MGRPTFFNKISVFFSLRWISFLKQIFSFVVQDGTQLQEIFSILYHKVGVRGQVRKFS